MDSYHIPVLLQPVCAYLQVRSGRKYIDATYGGGGHTAAICELGGEVLTIDQDPDSQAEVHANFSHLQEIARQKNWYPVSGILFDLGVSMHQLTAPERGFSLHRKGPLDMRMDPSQPMTAADLLNTLPQQQLKNIFLDYGEVKNDSLISKIISSRPIVTTDQLAGIINNKNLARKIFQALRIAVNDEMGSLRSALPQALELLEAGGRIIVISFHSLEDRLVKQQFNVWVNQNLGRVITKKPVIPGPEELAANPPSHSAKLRVFTKI